MASHQYLERVTHNSRKIIAREIKINPNPNSSFLSSLVNDALTQAKWAEKKWVWLVNKKEGFLPVTISAENGDKIEVSLEDGSVSFYPPDLACVAYSPRFLSSRL